MTLDPAEIEELDRRAGDPPVLRDLDLVRERLEFTPAVQRPKFDERGRPLAHALSFVIRPELIRAVASAFAASAPRRSMNCDKPAIRVDNDPHAAISPARSAAARRSAAVTRRDARRLPGTPRS